MEYICVVGCNGYIGNALVQRLLFEGYNVVGIDNNIKYKWARIIKSHSIISILNDSEKREKLKKFGKYEFIYMDISKDVDELESLLEKNSFHTIVNLGQQPSAAFSHLSLKTATETWKNNTIGTLNMLWLLSEYSKDTHYIEIESMGCHQPNIGIPIPEGYFYPEYQDIGPNWMSEKRVGRKSIFPKRPGSLYHASKTANTYLCDCACNWWTLPITAINQSVVYGNWTPEIDITNIHSPLWIDECFGTVVNRFIAQDLLGHNLTVYGKGDHKRGFIGLTDSVQALLLLIKNPPKRDCVRFVNQLDEIFSMNQLTTFFDTKPIHIESPRVEDTENFYYEPELRILKNLGFEKTTTIQKEIDYAKKHINTKLLEKAKHLIMPKIIWEH